MKKRAKSIKLSKAPYIKFEMFNFDNPPAISIKRGQLIPSPQQSQLHPSSGLNEEFVLNEVNEIKIQA